jgi:hypothetical protein
MWAKWGSPSILAGIGDLHINNSDARYETVFIEAKIDVSNHINMHINVQSH